MNSVSSVCAASFIIVLLSLESQMLLSPALAMGLQAPEELLLPLALRDGVSKTVGTCTCLQWSWR